MFPDIDIFAWAKFGNNLVVGSQRLISQKSKFRSAAKLPPVQVIALRLARGLLDPLLRLSACSGGAPIFFQLHLARFPLKGQVKSEKFGRDQGPVEPWPQ